MRVQLPYGEQTIEATVPDGAVVLLPQHTPALENPTTAVRAAIGQPLASVPLARLTRAGQRACIVVSDVTRPIPNATILPPILETLEAGGIAADDIVILIGTGLHRASRPDERERILGPEINARYRVVDHDARNASTHVLMPFGTDGDGIMLDREYMLADLRILTGFVEPHLFAGYSGGGKAVLPAIAGARNIMANHAARMIGHPNATWCTTAGNPIWEQMRDVALKSGPSFVVNVTLDERKRITGVFAGELTAAHDAAIAQAARQAIRPIPHLFDVVIATNMGYPADLMLYQSVKGISVAGQGCATGGAILLVAECREGLGEREYVDMMHSEASPRALLDRLDRAPETIHDQWGVQVQAMVQARCDVWLYSAIDRATTESFHLRYAEDLDSTIASIVDSRRTELGREPTVCVLPYGQLTVPRVSAP